MSDNVVSINGVLPSKMGEPQQHLINALQDVLELAREGRLQSLIATGFTSDGARVALWSDSHENVYEMLGALSWLQHEYVHRRTEALG